MRDFHRHLSRHVSGDEVAAVIDELAADPDVSGILLHTAPARPARRRHPDRPDTRGQGRRRSDHGQRPAGWPAANEDSRPAPRAVSSNSSTPKASNSGGACVAVVGWGELVGRPLAQLLLRRGATVTVAHEFTADLAAVTRPADIVVVATGVRGLVGPEHVKPGATVIDVGIHRTPEGLTGDVRAAELDGIASRITPVPGGVGPMTIAMLMVNTARAAEWNAVPKAVPA
ncbi:bifunctional 5,10-methylene-tetrahydrofolate dehydrogenase/5,10-methylene-tetrahydrofolate cyclohydrolase [Streptomyces sp. L7]